MMPSETGADESAMNGVAGAAKSPMNSELEREEHPSPARVPSASIMAPLTSPKRDKVGDAHDVVEARVEGKEERDGEGPPWEKGGHNTRGNGDGRARSSPWDESVSDEESSSDEDLEERAPFCSQSAWRGLAEYAQKKERFVVRPVSDAPLFCPSESEFEDPHRYIASIRQTADRFGICRIRPPAGFSPVFALAGAQGRASVPGAKEVYFQTKIQEPKKLLNRKAARSTSNPHEHTGGGQKGGKNSGSEEGKGDSHKRVGQRGGRVGLTAYAQKSPNRGDEILDEGERGNESFGFGTGKTHTLRSLGASAAQFKEDWFRVLDNAGAIGCPRCKYKGCNATNCTGKRRKGSGVVASRIPSIKEVESEFWRIVEEGHPGKIAVLYGSDLDAGTHGSGFPTKRGDPGAMSPDGLIDYVSHPWNLNQLPRLSSSLLRHINEPIPGIIIPWLYVGMCFSAFCWHVEDHNLYSLNYLHWGEPKVWYGVPGSKAGAFERAMKATLPDLFQAERDLLFQLVTLQSPWKLAKHGVPVYRAVQRPGEFVVTFPAAYHCGFNCGFNCAEAVNFASPDWLPFGAAAVERYANHKRSATLAHHVLISELARELPRRAAAKDAAAISAAPWVAAILERTLNVEQSLADVCRRAGHELVYVQGLEDYLRRERAKTIAEPRQMKLDSNAVEDSISASDEHVSAVRTGDELVVQNSGYLDVSVEAAGMEAVRCAMETGDAECTNCRRELHHSAILCRGCARSVSTLDSSPRFGLMFTLSCGDCIDQVCDCARKPQNLARGGKLDNGKSLKVLLQRTSVSDMRAVIGNLKSTWEDGFVVREEPNTPHAEPARGTPGAVKPGSIEQAPPKVSEDLPGHIVSSNASGVNSPGGARRTNALVCQNRTGEAKYNVTEGEVIQLQMLKEAQMALSRLGKPDIATLLMKALGTRDRHTFVQAIPDTLRMISNTLSTMAKDALEGGTGSKKRKAGSTPSTLAPASKVSFNGGGGGAGASSVSIPGTLAHHSGNLYPLPSASLSVELSGHSNIAHSSMKVSQALGMDGMHNSMLSQQDAQAQQELRVQKAAQAHVAQTQQAAQTQHTTQAQQAAQHAAQHAAAQHAAQQAAQVQHAAEAQASQARHAAQQALMQQQAALVAAHNASLQQSFPPAVPYGQGMPYNALQQRHLQLQQLLQQQQSLLQAQMHVQNTHQEHQTQQTHLRTNFPLISEMRVEQGISASPQGTFSGLSPAISNVLGGSMSMNLNPILQPDQGQIGQNMFNYQRQVQHDEDKR